MEKNNTQEEWKAIAECNGEYYVSNHGRVKSLKFGKERILKPTVVGNGYLAVDICILNKKRTMRTIHRLVALSFISNEKGKTDVNHKDGNKLNNLVENLEWMTRKENIQHAWDSGLFESTRLAISKAVSKAKSKPVVDIITGKKYDSLKLACLDINETYRCHNLRIFQKSKLQRFFYL
jgi:hypothetical protein